MNIICRILGRIYSVANLRPRQLNIVIQSKRCFLAIKINQWCIKQWYWRHKLVPGDSLDCIPNSSEQGEMKEVLKKRHINRTQLVSEIVCKSDSVAWTTSNVPVWVGYKYVNQTFQETKRGKQQNNFQQNFIPSKLSFKINFQTLQTLGTDY